MGEISSYGTLPRKISHFTGTSPASEVAEMEFTCILNFEFFRVCKERHSIYGRSCPREFLRVAVEDEYKPNYFSETEIGPIWSHLHYYPKYNVVGMIATSLYFVYVKRHSVYGRSCPHEFVRRSKINVNVNNITLC